MFRKLVIVMVILGLSAVASAASKRPVAQGFSETQKAELSSIINSTLSKNPAALGGMWEYSAKRMQPPKNDKWMERWNNLGREGWEVVGNIDNVFIFKRPATSASYSSYTRDEPKKEETIIEPTPTPINDKPAKAKKATKVIE